MDTLKCIIHSVSLDRKNAGTSSLLVEKAFTVASIDNVDFIQSNAAVYSGDQHCRWHATCIQLVQPIPITAVHSEQSRALRRLFNTAGEATDSESTESSSSQCAHVPAPPNLVDTEPAVKLRLLLSRKHTERSSPIASPLRSTRSPHTKRACTFAEAAKHHSKVVSDMEADSIRQPVASDTSSGTNRVQLESFQVTASEQDAVDNLNGTLVMC